MACTRERSEEIGELAGGRLGATESTALLAHLGECAACSAEIDLVADLLSAAQGLAAAQGPSLSLVRPRWRWILGGAALAAAALALVFAWPNEPKRRPRDLASVAPPPLTALVLRGGEPHSGEPVSADDVAIDRPLAEALEHIGERDYAAARSTLRTVLERRPEDALARFYLGIALLQTGEIEEALSALREAEERGEGMLREQALWYRIQGHLVLEQGAEARAGLERLVTLDGDYEPNARALLVELEALLDER